MLDLKKYVTPFDSKGIRTPGHPASELVSSQPTIVNHKTLCESYTQNLPTCAVKRFSFIRCCDTSLDNNKKRLKRITDELYMNCANNELFTEIFRSRNESKPSKFAQRRVPHSL